jgi:glutathione synthase/RimK-type ligase-like ATP-grasp enzyme
VDQILAHYDQIEAMKESEPSHNLWIVKPGENSNRGFGITVHSDRDELQQELAKRLEDGRRSVIVQKYL